MQCKVSLEQLWSASNRASRVILCTTEQHTNPRAHKAALARLWLLEWTAGAQELIPRLGFSRQDVGIRHQS